MSASLLILCLAAFTLVATLASSGMLATLPWLDGLALRLAPRARVRFWGALAALPGGLGGIAVLVSFLPAIGIGHDHCLSHGRHHPHLCVDHISGAPGVALIAIAAVMALRLGGATARLAIALRSSKRAARSFAQMSEKRDTALVYPSDEPRAFVLGAFRPRIHLSRGLVALGDDVVEPVLAHEHVHVRRRDLLWRALYPVIAAGHLPKVSVEIRSRLFAAQEMAADVEAAARLPGGRLRIAEALVILSRLATVSSQELSFTHGDVETRVRALLEDRAACSPWLTPWLAAGALVLLLSIGLSHDLVHHALETLLGVLS